MGVAGVKLVPYLTTSLLVFPPLNRGEPGLQLTMAQGQKLCRTYGAELPSLTDYWTRSDMTSPTGWSLDLPPYMWLGLRSYGEGQVGWETGRRGAGAGGMPCRVVLYLAVTRLSPPALACLQLFWSDGSFSTDGVLNAWEPGEFGDAACAIIVGPQGVELELEVGGLARWARLEGRLSAVYQRSCRVSCVELPSFPPCTLCVFSCLTCRPPPMPTAGGLAVQPLERHCHRRRRAHQPAATTAAEPLAAAAATAATSQAQQLHAESTLPT